MLTRMKQHIIISNICKSVLRNHKGNIMRYMVTRIKQHTNTYKSIRGMVGGARLTPR